MSAKINNYMDLQNLLIAEVATRVLTSRGSEEKKANFEAFLRKAADPENGLVDFLGHELNFCSLPFDRSGAEPYRDGSLVKRFFHELKFDGKDFRGESLVSHKEACVNVYLTIAVDLGLAKW
jgi:hypothetical protein